MSVLGVKEHAMFHLFHKTFYLQVERRRPRRPRRRSLAVLITTGQRLLYDSGM
jgi:hypothetical protein